MMNVIAAVMLSRFVSFVERIRWSFRLQSKNSRVSFIIRFHSRENNNSMPCVCVDRHKIKQKRKQNYNVKTYTCRVNSPRILCFYSFVVCVFVFFFFGCFPSFIPKVTHINRNCKKKTVFAPLAKIKSLHHLLDDSLPFGIASIFWKLKR